VEGFILGVIAVANGPCSPVGPYICGEGIGDVAMMTLALAGLGALLGFVWSAPSSGWKPVYDTTSRKGVRLEPTPTITVGRHGEPRLGVALNLRF